MIAFVRVATGESSKDAMETVDRFTQDVNAHQKVISKGRTGWNNLRGGATRNFCDDDHNGAIMLVIM